MRSVFEHKLASQLAVFQNPDWLAHREIMMQYLSAFACQVIGKTQVRQQYDFPLYNRLNDDASKGGGGDPLFQAAMTAMARPDRHSCLNSSCIIRITLSKLKHTLGMHDTMPIHVGFISSPSLGTKHANGEQRLRELGVLICIRLPTCTSV